jgi:pimeloyl-ACP methyl ester carboxylesterase
MAGRVRFGAVRTGVSALVLLGVAACAAVGQGQKAVPPAAADAAQLLAALSIDDPAAMRTTFDTLLALSPVNAPAPGADLEALRTALPEGLSLTWASEQTRPDGALVVTDLVLSGPDGIGLRASSLRLWGFDGAALGARMRGERTDERLPIFSRLEAEGLRVEGLEDAMTAMNQGLQDGMAEGMGELFDLPGEDVPLPDTAYTDFSFSIGRLNMGQMALRPIQPLAEGNTSAAYFQFWRVPELDWISVSDMVMSLRFTQAAPDTGTTIGFSADYIFERYNAGGIRGGDFDAWQAGPMKASVALSVVGEEGSPAIEPFRFTMGLDGGFGGGGRLDRAYELLVAQKWPDRAETDFLSFGKATLNGLRFSLGEIEVFRAGTMAFDASQWHGLIPTAIDLRLEDANFDYLGYFDAILRMVPTLAATGEDTTAIVPEELEMMAKGISALRPVFGNQGYDEAYSWRWDPATGAASLTIDNDYRGWFSFDFALNGTLATHDAMWPEGAKTPYAGLKAALPASAQFSGATLTLGEQGGIDRALRGMIAIAKVFPEQEGMSFFVNGTPESLRAFAYGMMGMAAGEAAKEFPPARDFVISAANWVRDGNVLTLKVTPPAPIGVAALEGLAESEMSSDPDALVRFFGLSVVHTPPVKPVAAPAQP